MKKLYLIFLLCCVNLALANTLRVPADYPLIQSALDQSVNGDTIEVSPGTYYENINFRGKNVVLTSLFYVAMDTTYIHSTIIDGSQATGDSGTCVIFNSGEDSTAVLQGFTITGGTGTAWVDIHGAGTYREGGGVITEFSSPTIQYNLITDNHVDNTTGVLSTGGGGIRSGDGSPVIRNNTICNNTARYGCGIVMNYASGRILNNLIAHNSGGQNFGGGGIWCTGTDTNTIVTVTNNTIVDNHIAGTGILGGRGSALLTLAVKVNLRNNIIWGNTERVGGPFTISNNGKIIAAYNNIDSTYTGIGNINSDPVFVDSYHYLLTSTSPSVDSGDSSQIYEDPNTAGTVIFPALGSSRNDQGTYGGPSAFLMPGCNSLINTIASLTASNGKLLYTSSSDMFIYKSEEADENMRFKAFSSDGKSSEINAHYDPAGKHYILTLKVKPGLYIIQAFSKGTVQNFKTLVRP